MSTGTRSQVSPSDTYGVFDTEEPFKAAAQRLGVSSNTLRRWWVEKFGQEAFDVRGRRLQAARAASFNQGQAGRSKKLKVMQEPCAACGTLVEVNSVQRARLTQVLCASCVEAQRGVDRHCPVCGFGCVGVKGLASHMVRPQNGDAEAHKAYLEAQQERLWEGKVEGRDYVTCMVCGHRGERIDKHLLAEHDLTTEAYRLLRPEAPVQASALVEKRIDGLRQHHQANPRKGRTKALLCPSCGHAHLVGLTFASSDRRCPACRDAARWDGRVEGRDYVVCAVCGHRAESLVSHIRSVHPDLEGKYQETFPGMLVTALGSGIRDKAALKERTLSDETRALMSQNAGRWNAGLTKGTDSRVAAGAAKMVGRPAWNVGLTKTTDPRLQTSADTLAQARAVRFWTNGNEVSLTPEQLLPFALKNGKISVGRAIAALGHAFVTIRRECYKHGLEISHTAISQAICLETISQVLGGALYEMEWNDGTFINPTTGGRFRFDGFFPEQKLLVEFHGYQHWNPDAVWFFEGGEAFNDLVARDTEKLRQVTEDGRYHLLVVREDEPYTDPDWLRQRLLDVLPV